MYVRPAEVEERRVSWLRGRLLRESTRPVLAGLLVGVALSVGARYLLCGILTEPTSWTASRSSNGSAQPKRAI